MKWLFILIPLFSFGQKVDTVKLAEWQDKALSVYSQQEQRLNAELDHVKEKKELLWRGVLETHKISYDSVISSSYLAPGRLVITHKRKKK